MQVCLVIPRQIMCVFCRLFNRFRAAIKKKNANVSFYNDQPETFSAIKETWRSFDCVYFYPSFFCWMVIMVSSVDGKHIYPP